MYRCILPDSHSLQEIEPEFERLDKIEPVVAILTTNLVKDALDKASQGSFSANEARLEKIHQELKNNKPLVLPIILHNGSYPVISSGRHRTSALWFIGISEVPFLTAKAMAESIYNELGGQPSSTNYDLSDIPYPVFTA